MSRLLRSRPARESWLRAPFAAAVGTTAHELFNQAIPVTDQIIETRQKTQQMHPQPGIRVSERGQVSRALGDNFYIVKHREIGRLFDLQIAQPHSNLVKVALHLTQ
jgi:hypothetical protein